MGETQGRRAALALAVAIPLMGLSAGPGVADAAPALCPVPASSAVKVRILAPGSGDVIDPAAQPSLAVSGLIKGKGFEAVTGVTLYLDGTDSGAAPITATTPATRAKGADGVWAGAVPLTPGIHDLTACARAANGPVAVDTIRVVTPLVTTDHLPGAIVGRAYHQQLTTTVPNAVWQASGLPAGLSLSSTGLLSGTPAAAGTPTLMLRVVDRKAPQLTARAALVLTIAAAGGTVCAWGAGDSGQLGDDAPFGPNTVAATPVGTGLTGVTAVAATRSTGYALKSDGTVWAWGDAENGQLGAGAAAGADTSTPVPVSGLSDVVAISGAAATAYALKRDGTVWAWGLGGYAGLGNGTYDQSSDVPVQVTGLTGVTAISGGGLTAYAVKGDGTVWGWGEGGAGQLGDQPGWSASYSTSIPVQIGGVADVTAVSGGELNGYARSRDGSVWAWGAGTFGAIGDGSTDFGAHRTPVTVLTGATAIAAGDRNGYAVKSDGTVWGWGRGAFGANGNGAVADSPVPVPATGLTGVTGIAHAIGSTHYAVPAAGSVSAWGLGDYGALGNGQGVGTYLYLSSTPVAVTGPTGVTATAGGGRTGYAVAASCLSLAAG